MRTLLIKLRNGRTVSLMTREKEVERIKRHFHKGKLKWLVGTDVIINVNDIITIEVGK